MSDLQIGTRLQFPDGDYARIIRINEYKDEEDDAGIYDAKEIVFVIEGDETQQEFNEYLDSRESYQLNVMKLV